MKVSRVLGFVCLAVVFVLVLLMFFSKTLYYYNVPTVTVAKPANGNITKRGEASGSAQWQDVRKIYAAVGGEVEALFIEEGGAVQAGQAVATLKRDTTQIQEQLALLVYDEQQVRNDIANANAKIQYNQSMIAAEQAKTYAPEPVTGVDTASIKERIAWAQEEYDRTSALFEAGMSPKVDADKAYQALVAVQNELATAEANIAEQQRKAEEAVKTQQQERDTRVAQYQQEIDTYYGTLAGYNTSLEKTAAQRAQYEAQLARYAENSTVYSDYSGTVKELNISLGEILQDSALVASVGIEGSMMVEAELAKENTFTAVGDACELKGAGAKATGTILSIGVEDSKRMMKIALDEGSAVSEGEQFDITLTKKREEEVLLVPNAAVNKDTNGSYVYQIKERDGLLGKEYYAEKLKITVGESDGENTEVRDGIKFIEPLILSSDKSFAAGDTVQVKNQEVLLAK